MNKITLIICPAACVYIRQSTPGQVQHNLKVNAANMAWSIVRARWAGKTST